MAVTRVLLARLPGLLGDIVRAIVASDADLQIVAELPDVDGVPAAVRSARAQVVVVGGVTPAETPTLLATLLAAVLPVNADVRLVALDADGQGATSATAHGQRRVAALSSDGLLDLLRG